jgi:23S rRNA (uracil1939-C5)-methyltransferase
MDNLQHYYGEKYLIEKILNFEFKISPLSFFQVNIKATELLFEKIKVHLESENKENQILLDIYSGLSTNLPLRHWNIWNYFIELFQLCTRI